MQDGEKQPPVGPDMQGGQSQGRRMTVDNPEVQSALRPEELEQYKKAFTASIRMLYGDKKFVKSAKNAVEKSPSLAAGIGQLAAAIGARVFQAAQKSNDPLTPNVVFLAGVDVVREVARFAGGVTGKPVGEEVIEDAFLVASDRMRGMLGKSAEALMADPEQGQQLIDQAGGASAVEAMQRRKQAAMMVGRSPGKSGLGEMV